jgi:hypothetical protein
MIVFDLLCEDGHRFEGWFGSSGDFERQQQDGLLACPRCGSTSVGKAVMAPAVGRKGNQLPPSSSVAPQPPLPAKAVPMSAPAVSSEAARMMRALAKMQTRALENSRWVGDSFAEDARAMHYGERKQETIHGQTTAEEASALLEEGIGVMPLPFPVAPPGEAN